jgi:hypothetical protein
MVEDTAFKNPEWVEVEKHLPPKEPFDLKKRRELYASAVAARAQSFKFEQST